MTYDFVIVGAGLAGGSTAYYLRQIARAQSMPQPRVLILEQEPTPGVHSSGRNAALVRRKLDDPSLATAAAAGADLLAQGHLATFRKTGSILIGLGDDDVSSRFPLATGKGLWCPDDGVVDVAELLNTYLHDQEIRYNQRVLGWEDHSTSDAASNQKLLSARTADDTITTKTIINAAGAWAGDLGSLPLTPTTRHLFVTPPMQQVAVDWPFVWDVKQGLYFRPESGGLLLCACDETQSPPGQYNEDPAMASHLAELVHDHQPTLGDLQIQRGWVGQRTFAPDRRFVIGFDPRDNRVFHVAALGGNGVTTSPEVGSRAANLLLSQRQAQQDDTFNPARLF